MKKIFILLFVILFGIIVISLSTVRREKTVQRENIVQVQPVQQVIQLPIQYAQIGFLTPLSNEKDQILPLMGRRRNRDYWNYYTLSNQHNNIRLPMTFKGKNTMADYGVQEIDNLAVVLVEGYNTNFKVNMYTH